MALFHIGLGLLAFEPEMTVNTSHNSKRKHVYSLNQLPFRMHVWLPQRKGIDIRSRIQVRQAVVDESVRRLIGANSIDEVNQLGVTGHAPVVDGDLWCRLVGPTKR